MDSCIKHPHEPGVDICGRCGGSWCSSCLVYSFGPKKPPFCLGCAMVAGGVRTAATRPAMAKRELKALQKAAKAEAKAAAKAAKGERGVSEPEPVPEGELEGELVSAASEVDAPEREPSGWEKPWWEDHREPTYAD
jgi:hypothetical protein